MGNKRYFYITPEDFKIAEENGIPEYVVTTRVRKLGWDIDRAITKPVRSKRKFTEEQIKIMEENGIDRNTASGRLNKGWDPKEALTRPQKRGRQRIYPDWAYEEADKHGIRYSALGNRIRRGMSLEEACTEKVITKQEALEIGRKKLKESREVGINE